jgi:anhydro-N-acetylmuramic acid kinase
LSGNVHHIIGLMSGSSLDGLDIAYCVFEENNGRWSYEIAVAECADFDDDLRQSLRELRSGTIDDLAQMHTALGQLFGEWVRVFMDKHGIACKVEAISSHGHTILHQPKLGYSLQIGSGADIAAATGKTVICDLRSADIAYGGQGAPIVPMAEKMLFPDYRVFLNLGGIANISFHRPDGVTAFDVCGCNTLLNNIAQKKGSAFDSSGIWARQGRRAEFLFSELNNDPYCQLPPPKSLGTEYLQQQFLPKYEGLLSSANDMLHTTVEHIGLQVGKAFETSAGKVSQNEHMLITGGGAFNSYLVDTIAHYAPVDVVVPDELTVSYKEAMAMAFLGLLRLQGQPNCLRSVTGATYDAIGGAVYLPSS